jgi:hypothetical protein
MTAPKRRYVTGAEVEQLLKDHPRLNLNVPGSMTLIRQHLSPEDDQLLLQGLNRIDNAVELGRWGDPARVCAEMEADPGVTARVYNSAQVDYVVSKLEERRSDATLPLPEITRRDQIGAAMDAFDTPDPEET